MRNTDLEIATSEEEHAKYAKLHPVAKDVADEPVVLAESAKGQVENIQEHKSDSVAELEEQYNRWVKYVGQSI